MMQIFKHTNICSSTLNCKIASFFLFITTNILPQNVFNEIQTIYYIFYIAETIMTSGFNKNPS